MITGFPGEDEEAFEKLLDFVRETRFDRLGAFAFSPEEGTPAVEMPGQVEESVKQERLDRLMTLQQAISFEINEKRIGEITEVLVESVTPDGFTGRSSKEAPEVDGEITVKTKNTPPLGSYVNVRITGADAYDLSGEMI